MGIALFEAFHDVQYLAIVWIYNRTRVERDQTIGGFMRFVFRRSGALIRILSGLGFGLWGVWPKRLLASPRNGSGTVLIGIVTASALLHFYYDGFIWKVRETQTRTMLGIEGTGAGCPGGASAFAGLGPARLALGGTGNSLWSTLRGAVGRPCRAADRAYSAGLCRSQAKLEFRGCARRALRQCSSWAHGWLVLLL